MHQFRKVHLTTDDDLEFKGNIRSHTYMGVSLARPEVGAFVFAPDHTKEFLNHYWFIQNRLELPKTKAPRRYSRVYTTLPELVIFIIGQYEESNQNYKLLDTHADDLYEVVSQRLYKGQVPVSYQKRRVMQQLIDQRTRMSLGWWFI